MYEDFAFVYDRLMDVDYTAFADGYENIFRRFGAHPHMVLDLGCGTGSLTSIMASRGYEMIGVEGSPEMLSVAREKAEESGQDILYLCQDMTEFELYGTVDAAYSSLDSLNYLLTEDAMRQTFHWVNNYLMDEGLFLFDLNSPYKLKTILGNNTFVTEEDGIFYTWENEYDEERKICTFLLNLFCEEPDGAYSRIVEEQAERAYTPEEIKALLEESGMELLAVYGADFASAPTATEERLFFVAKAHNHNKVTES